MEGMNQFGIQYIYTWNCHNETPHIAIVNKQKRLFSKTEDRKINQVLSGCWYSGRGEDIGKSKGV
jgi:hypothetical protein